MRSFLSCTRKPRQTGRRAAFTNSSITGASTDGSIDGKHRKRPQAGRRWWPEAEPAGDAWRPAHARPGAAGAEEGRAGWRCRSRPALSALVFARYQIADAVKDQPDGVPAEEGYLCSLRQAEEQVEAAQNGGGRN